MATKKSRGCCGMIFLIVNFLFSILGCLALAYGIWIMVANNNVNNLLSGTLIFTYFFIGAGLLLFVMGILGCCGVCAKNRCCLRIFIIMMILLFVFDVVVGIAGGVRSAEVFDLMDTLWDEVNSDTRNQIQKELECCGYTDPVSEYPLNGYPDSCFGDAQATVKTEHSTTCKTAMQQWLHSNIPIWVSILVSIVVLQIITFISSCFTLRKLGGKKNKVVPAKPTIIKPATRVPSARQSAIREPVAPAPRPQAQRPPAQRVIATAPK